MIEPWHNFPTQKWDWYFRDFPNVAIDIGVWSYAHFDHDASHTARCACVARSPDRYIRVRGFEITGIADKHETDSSQATWDFKRVIMEMDGIDITPPNNLRSWNHCLLLIETGGLRIVHWGDNRHNSPTRVRNHLGHIDVVLMPIDQSRHVMGYDMAEAAIDQLQPHVVIPHHYYIFDVIQRQSTLMPADEWVTGRAHQRLASATKTYTRAQLEGLDRMVHYFGEHVAFDTKAWRDGEG